MQSALVSTSWLNNHISHPDIVILDASMEKVVGKEPLTYDSPTFIPNAKKLNLETDFCDLTAKLSHTMPTAGLFRATCKKLGIGPTSQVVIYDNQGMYSAPRAWWTFRLMGFESVYVLNGGLPQWQKEGFAVVDTVSTGNTDQTVSVNLHKDKICDSKHVFACLAKTDTNILDARSFQRFAGKAPEPRSGVRSGHIPGSLSLPFANVLNEFKMKPAAELKKIFKPLANTQHIFSCGSGITACILILAAYEAQLENLCLYDGSWSDWGSDDSLPLESV